MSTPGPDGRAVDLAAAALHAALRDDVPAAQAALQALSDEYGGEGITVAICAWCDTVNAQYRRIHRSSGTSPVQPVWVNADAGGVTLDADGVPPEIRWAGQVIAARSAMDHDSFRALLAALPKGEVGFYVSALLGAAALTLRNLNATAGQLN